MEGYELLVVGLAVDVVPNPVKYEMASWLAC